MTAWLDLSSELCESWHLTVEVMVPRAVAWEPSRATYGACKCRLDDVLMHISSVRCDVLNSKCRGLWCLLAPKCTCAMLFFRCKHCAHDGCVNLTYVGTLHMVYFALCFIYK